MLSHLSCSSRGANILSAYLDSQQHALVPVADYIHILVADKHSLNLFSVQQAPQPAVHLVGPFGVESFVHTPFAHKLTAVAAAVVVEYM